MRDVAASVQLAREKGKSVAKAAWDLDLHENVLRKWIRAYEEDPTSERRFANPPCGLHGV